MSKREVFVRILFWKVPVQYILRESKHGLQQIPQKRLIEPKKKKEVKIQVK